jgi:hypothetical protein
MMILLVVSFTVITIIVGSITLTKEKKWGKKSGVFVGRGLEPKWLLEVSSSVISARSIM